MDQGLTAKYHNDPKFLDRQANSEDPDLHCMPFRLHL